MSTSPSPEPAGTWARSCCACSPSTPRCEITAVTSERLAGEPLGRGLPAPARAERRSCSRSSTPSASPPRPTSSSSRCRTWSRSGGARCCGGTGGRWSTSRPTTGCATPRSTRPGTRRRTSTPPGSPRRSTGCPSCTGRRSRAPRWWPRPAATRWARSSPPRRCSRAGWGRRTASSIDGKSGVTGAGAQGRKVDPMYLFTEANENVPGLRHRHPPAHARDRAGALARWPGEPVVVGVHAAPRAPQSRPLHHGLGAADASRRPPRSSLALYQEFYAGEPFVRVLRRGRAARPRAASWARTSAT